MGTALLDSLTQTVSPTYESNINSNIQTPEPVPCNQEHPNQTYSIQPPQPTLIPHTYINTLTVETPSSSTNEHTNTDTNLSKNELLLTTFKKPESPKPRRTLLPTPTVKIIQINTNSTKLPIKITMKIDTNNMPNYTLLDNINQPVNSFYMTVDRDEQFWKLPQFFSSIKVRAANKINKSFPVTILANSKINYDVLYTKSIYRAHDNLAISVLNTETIVGLQHLPRPLFLSNPDEPAEIVAVFEIHIQTSYTPSTQEFVSSVQRLALTNLMDPMESIALLLAYYAKYKKAVKRDISVYKTSTPNAIKRFRQN